MDCPASHRRRIQTSGSRFLIAVCVCAFGEEVAAGSIVACPHDNGGVPVHWYMALVAGNSPSGSAKRSWAGPSSTPNESCQSNAITLITICYFGPAAKGARRASSKRSSQRRADKSRGLLVFCGRARGVSVAHAGLGQAVVLLLFAQLGNVKRQSVYCCNWLITSS
ncbi:hypothetical protein JOL62DRAFT_561119 [Phyllosticta paracitricarpa]|uniref:Secreted protein n=1 Tax=Phyllosticta paracitricarpa TaxID=2016321 RepID=A0ABR1NJH6_9PEZI